jgi:dTDP-4-amino-4,6-dideoxygalactose transaminase
LARLPRSAYPERTPACGEAARTTDDEQIAKKIKMLREHGQAQKDYHDLEGTTAGQPPSRRRSCGSLAALTPGTPEDARRLAAC